MARGIAAADAARRSARALAPTGAVAPRGGAPAGRGETGGRPTRRDASHRRRGTEARGAAGKATAHERRSSRAGALILVAASAWLILRSAEQLRSIGAVTPAAPAAPIAPAARPRRLRSTVPRGDYRTTAVCTPVVGSWLQSTQLSTAPLPQRRLAVTTRKELPDLTRGGDRRVRQVGGSIGFLCRDSRRTIVGRQHLHGTQRPTIRRSSKYRQMLGSALPLARAQIGELAIEDSRPGAEVVLKAARPAPPLSSVIYLPARNAEVVVRAPGHSERRERIPIAGGQRHELTVNLEKLEKPAEQPSVIAVTSPPPSPTPAPAPSAPAVVEHRSADADGSGSGLRTFAWVFGGGALAAAGAGLALTSSRPNPPFRRLLPDGRRRYYQDGSRTGGYHPAADACQDRLRRLGVVPALEHRRLRHRCRACRHLHRPLPDLTPTIHGHAGPH